MSLLDFSTEAHELLARFAGLTEDEQNEVFGGMASRLADQGRDVGKLAGVTAPASRGSRGPWFKEVTGVTPKPGRGINTGVMAGEFLKDKTKLADGALVMCGQGEARVLLERDARAVGSMVAAMGGSILVPPGFVAVAWESDSGRHHIAARDGSIVAYKEAGLTDLISDSSALSTLESTVSNMKAVAVALWLRGVWK